MLPSLFLAAAAGARSMTPLAVVSVAAARGVLMPQPAGLRFLSSKMVAAGTLTLAVGELAGDKLEAAPNRTILAGLAGRAITGAIAAAAVEPRRKGRAAVLGAGIAISSAFLTLRARLAAQERFGRLRSGLVEDAVTVGLAAAIVARG